ncbi:MAG: hypothetical protein MUQ10_13530 [Anaerolineae bacterium]|nr:hypothetical protein [Anaerolineae bacterium]
MNDREDELDRANAWVWLQKYEPDSYEQLIKKAGYAAEGLAQSGRSELGQLARVFTWCRDHGVELAALGLPKHLAKYREAAGELHRIVTNQTEVSATREELLAAIQTIQAHPTRKETRLWARPPRSGK